MDDQNIAPDDFLALLQDLDNSSLPAFETANDESTDATDLVDLDLDLFSDESGGIELESRSVSSTEFRSDVVATIGSSSSHAERCRMNRKRKKEELEELRASASALQTVLRRLQEQASQQSSEVLSASSPPWRVVSKRSLVECQRAARENSQLREMLQQQFNAAREIQRAIHAAPDMLPHLLPARASPSIDRFSKWSRPGAPLISSALTHRGEQFHDLFRNIHALYEQNASGEELGWLKIGTRKISMEMVTRAGSDCMDMCVQVMECQQLPLSLKEISDATWKHLSTPYVGEVATPSGDCGRTALNRCGNDLFGDCGSECKPFPVGSDAPLGRLAIRRYVEANRLTFVWECDGCYQCDAAKNPIGRVAERGWCTIEPSGNDPASKTTVLRIQVQYAPQKPKCDHPGGGCQPSKQVNLSSDLALKLYRGTIARTFGAVEMEVFN